MTKKCEPNEKQNNLNERLSFCGCLEIASTGVIQAPYKVPWWKAEFMAVKLGSVLEHRLVSCVFC